jgi:catechol 2,3-dioxygenase
VDAHDARGATDFGACRLGRWFFEASEFPDEPVREPLLAANPATLEDYLSI